MVEIIPKELELVALGTTSYWDVFVHPQKDWKLDHLRALHTAIYFAMVPYPISLKIVPFKNYPIV